MEARNLSDFMAEVYLKSTPSLNLEELNADSSVETVNPNNYTLPESVFNELLEKHGFTFSDVFGVMLNKGPKIKISKSCGS